MNPRPFIILVNWNLKNDTSTCIQSLVQAGADLSRLIVVDNGSEDGSVAHLRGQFGPALQVIELGTNLGFAAGTNLGIRAAIQQEAEWLLLINNDTWVAADFFEKLFKAIESRPDVSAFGPAIFYAGDPGILWYLGERLIPGTMLTFHGYRGKPLPADLPAVLPVDFLSGCAMLVKRKAFEDSGLLDAGLFMYGEEVDWCWRARRAGHSLAAVPSAAMWHKVSASANRTSARTRYLRVRNQIWGYRRYGNAAQRALLTAFTLLRVLGMSLRDLLAGEKELRQSAWRGWVDGWYQLLPPVQETVQR